MVPMDRALCHGVIHLKNDSLVGTGKSFYCLRENKFVLNFNSNAINLKFVQIVGHIVVYTLSISD